jgi:predicted nucleic acid-binding protein
MESKSVFLDANILLEIILGRAQDAKARHLIEKSNYSFYISSLTAHLVVHFGQSIVDLPILREFLTDYNMLNLESADFEWAFVNMRNKLPTTSRSGCYRFQTNLRLVRPASA